MHRYNVMVAYNSKLPHEEFAKRFKYLTILQRILEPVGNGPGRNLYKNVTRALNKRENFTGLLRLDYYQQQYLFDLLQGYPYDTTEYAVISYYINQSSY